MDAGSSEGFLAFDPKYLLPRSSFSKSLSSPGCRGSSLIDCDAKPLASLLRRFWLRLRASESAERLLFLMIVPIAPNVPLSESMPGCSVFSTITPSFSVSLESLSANVAFHTGLAPASMSVAEWETPSGVVDGAWLRELAVRRRRWGDDRAEVWDSASNSREALGADSCFATSRSKVVCSSTLSSKGSARL